jgi:hypothetical protein
VGTVLQEQAIDEKLDHTQHQEPEDHPAHSSDGHIFLSFSVIAQTAH